MSVVSLVSRIIMEHKRNNGPSSGPDQIVLTVSEWVQFLEELSRLKLYGSGNPPNLRNPIIYWDVVISPMHNNVVLNGDQALAVHIRQKHGILLDQTYTSIDVGEWRFAVAAGISPLYTVGDDDVGNK